jgi:hypothetical protein
VLARLKLSTTFALLSHPAGDCVQRAAAQEELEEHQQPVRRREDAQQVGGMFFTHAGAQADTTAMGMSEAGRHQCNDAQAPTELQLSLCLCSLSLVFALHHYKPTPLYVMDEIDAALGESGS